MSKKIWSSGVVILSGFLGAGKTTLVQVLLKSCPPEMKIAVVVNDLAAVNIDASMIKKSTEDMVELSNGCICCNLRAELLAELVTLHKQKRFTHIIVECTGVAEPMQVAETFFLPTVKKGKKQGVTLHDMGLHLTSCITVVDAYAFEEHMQGKVARLMTEQVEFANLVIVNKTDLAPSNTVARVVEIVKRMNPRCRIETSKFSELPDTARLLTEEIFTLEEAALQGEWMNSLELYVDHSEGDVYDISSFVYRSQRPFHPARLYQYLFHEVNKSDDLKKYPVLRMKGYVWIGSKAKHDLQGYLNLAGNVVTVEPSGKWLSALSDEELPSDITAEEKALVHQDWLGDGFTFDRRQEIVVIGYGKKEDTFKGLQEYLDTLLMTPKELEGGLFGAVDDPFLDWSGIPADRKVCSAADHNHNDQGHDHPDIIPTASVRKRRKTKK